MVPKQKVIHVLSPHEILIVALLAAPVLALIDVLRMPADLWEASSQNQALWAVLVLVKGPPLERGSLLEIVDRQSVFHSNA